MVEFHYILGKTDAHAPTDERHKRLKTTEENAHQVGFAPVEGRHCQSFAHGYGKGIHGKADSNKECGEKVHQKNSAINESF